MLQKVYFIEYLNREKLEKKITFQVLKFYFSIKGFKLNKYG